MALTGELRYQVLEKAMSDEILSPIVTVLIFTGLRPGELLALKWKHIDLVQKKITVKQAVNKEIEFDADGKPVKKTSVIGQTKTVLSVRTVGIADVVADALLRWKSRQVEQEVKRGLHLTEPDNFVFCTKMGTMRTYAGLRSLLVRFIQKNGWTKQGIHLYTFRHTFATMLLEARENPKIVSELMGHSTVNTTLRIYSHVTEAVYEKTTQTLDAVYTNLFKDTKMPAFNKPTEIVPATKII